MRVLLRLAFPLILGTGLARAAVDASYSMEISPIIGINLPYDLWGADTLNVLGLRGAYRLPSPTGAFESGILYHHNGADKAYTFDLAYRHELYTGFINGFFVVGAHFSRYSLTIDRDSAGNCVPVNCQTDSGNHTGVTYGGGLLVPIGETDPLRLGVRFYNNPQTWLLLEAGWGFRF